MHDFKGRPLKVGDRVLIPCEVKELFATEEFCNITLETVQTRLPDRLRERISAINSHVVYRANVGDDNKELV
jgi:hypothetical protein